MRVGQCVGQCVRASVTIYSHKILTFRAPLDSGDGAKFRKQTAAILILTDSVGLSLPNLCQKYI